MTYTIEYPQRNSHNEVQAALWYALRHLKLDARLEVPAHRGRLDVVVFVSNVPRLIIECKSWSRSYMRVARYQKRWNSKQVHKYRDNYGLPVYVCGHMTHIDDAVDWAKRELASVPTPSVK
jgi:hypothetical protein